MSLVSKRLLSSQSRAQELLRTCFPFPRCHASAGTTIGSQQGAALPSVETLPPVVTRSGLASLSPGGRNVRALSSHPSFDGHEKDRTTQTTVEVDRTLLRNVRSGGLPFLPNDYSKSKGSLAWMSWQNGSKAFDLSCLSSPKMTQSISGFSTIAGNNSPNLQKLVSNSDHMKKHQRSDGGHPQQFPMRVKYLNTVLLLPLVIIYNKISPILLNLSLFWHLNQGIKEIMADYVHQEMTRHLIMICLRLLLLIAMKDVFVSVAF